MIGFLVRATIKVLLLAAVLYGTFFVPLGRYTLYGHFSRIAGTAEAQELTGEVAGALEEASAGVSDRVGKLASRDTD